MCMALENNRWIPRLCSGSDLKKEVLFLAQSAPIKEDPNPARPTLSPTKRPTVVTEVTNKPTVVTEVTNKPTAITDISTNRPTAITDDNTIRPTAATTIEDEPEIPTPSK